MERKDSCSLESSKKMFIFGEWVDFRKSWFSKVRVSWPAAVCVCLWFILCLSAETVQSAVLALQGIINVHDSHILSSAMLCVGDRVTNNHILYVGRP
jgi:hypothetical protein